MKTTILIVILALSAFAKEEEKSLKKRGVAGVENFHGFNQQVKENQIWLPHTESLSKDHADQIALPQHQHQEIDLGTTIHEENVQGNEHGLVNDHENHQHGVDFGSFGHEELQHFNTQGFENQHQSFQPESYEHQHFDAHSFDNKHHEKAVSTASLHQSFEPSKKVETTHFVSHEHGTQKSKTSEYVNFVSHDDKSKHGPSYSTVSVHRVHTKPQITVGYSKPEDTKKVDTHIDQVTFLGKNDHTTTDFTNFVHHVGSEGAKLEEEKEGIYTFGKSDGSYEHQIGSGAGKFNEQVLLGKERYASGFGEEVSIHHIQESHSQDAKTTGESTQHDNHEIDLGSSIHEHYTITKKVGIPYPAPYPVHVEKKIPIPVPHPVHVYVDKPYNVHVPKPYPVYVDKPVPYVVYKNIAVPVKVAVKVPVKVPVAVPVHKPYPVLVHKKVPVHIPEPVYIKKYVPFIVKVEKPEHKEDWKN